MRAPLQMLARSPRGSRRPCIVCEKALGRSSQAGVLHVLHDLHSCQLTAEKRLFEKIGAGPSRMPKNAPHPPHPEILCGSVHAVRNHVSRKNGPRPVSPHRKVKRTEKGEKKSLQMRRLFKKWKPRRKRLRRGAGIGTTAGKRETPLRTFAPLAAA